MKNGRNWNVIQRLDMGAYAAGTLANVCWTPHTPSSTRVQPHVHTFYEVVFVEAGRGSHVINGSAVPAEPGHLALLAPGSSHDPRRLPGSAVFWVFIFNAHALNTEGWPGAVYAGSERSLGAAQILLHHLYGTPHQHLLFQIARADRPGIIRHLRAIEEENARRHIGSDELIASHLNILLVDLLRRTLNGAPATDRSTLPIVSRAMTFIDVNFRKTIALADVARHVGCSPAHLTSLVRRHTGMSAMAWLSDRRLWEAKGLVLTSRMSIRQIAATLGYKSVRHFSFMFKRRYGDSPLQWRRRIIT